MYLIALQIQIFPCFWEKCTRDGGWENQYTLSSSQERRIFKAMRRTCLHGHSQSRVPEEATRRGRMIPKPDFELTSFEISHQGSCEKLVVEGYSQDQDYRNFSDSQADCECGDWLSNCIIHRDVGTQLPWIGRARMQSQSDRQGRKQEYPGNGDVDSGKCSNKVAWSWWLTCLSRTPGLIGVEDDKYDLVLQKQGSGKTKAECQDLVQMASSYKRYNLSRKLGLKSLFILSEQA